MAAVELQPIEAQNINISAYRVLAILLVLVQYRSLNMIELNRFLYENPMIRRIYNTETLTKYINTLREVGCDIPRCSSRTDYCYELRKHPFALKLEPDEIQIADKLLSLLSNASDEILYRDYRDFLEWLSWAIETDPAASPSTEKITLLFPELEVKRKLITEYRQYCHDAFTLQLRYQTDDQSQKDLLVEPHELLERGNRLLLLGFDPQSQEQVMLDVEKIEQIRQLPSKNKRTAHQTTVVFALFDRLAKSYRLYPDEKIIYQNSKELHIKTKVKNLDELTNRLLKYGVSCEVISPLSLRSNMQARISRLLTHLGSPELNS
jgi:predicted DNA-binding transcriptional regulator YafY